MAIAFWSSLALLAFTYIGYPVLVGALARFRPRPVLSMLPSPAHAPRVDVLLVVHNAADQLREKLANLARLDYPADRLCINVVCDGCTDESEHVARMATGHRIRVFSHPRRRGKSACIGDAIPHLDGDVVLFTDVRQRINAQAVIALVSALADPRVGAASGELVLLTDGGYGSGIDAYWRYEKLIRRLESASGSLIGVTGALYAARRTDLPAVPAGIVLDDMWIPLRIAASGLRVVFVPKARAYDWAGNDPRDEEVRKRRTLSGNYQLLHLWPHLLLPGGHPLAWRLWGHKWLRLLAPWLLLLALVSNASLALSGSVGYAWVLALHVSAYALALAGRVAPRIASAWLPARLATAFVSLNTSALLGLVDYLRNPEVHLWKPASARGT